MRRFALFLCVMPLLIAGCIFYEQDTELNEDGSGEMEIHYWISENVLSWFKGGALSFNEDSVRAQYASDGIVVKSVRTESREVDSTRHVFVALQFDDIQRLSACTGFKDIDIKWMREGDVFRFVQSLPSTSSSGDGMLDNFTFTYRYNFPGEVRESNADTIDGDHAVWVFKLSDLNDAKKMEAVIVASSGTSVWWVLGILVVVVLAALILWIRRKRQ
ncbi:MAG: hypothetical protein IH600_04855 [Bacteroidetes bacterium]|nr:hypothetical protein [Bacteroidota bacterium]